MELLGTVIGYVVDAVSLALLLGGSFFYLVGMIGLIRMPDVFTRMHAVSVAETLGVGLLVLGMILQAGFTLVAVKLVFILVLLLTAGPVISHALARAALHDGQDPLIADEDGRLTPTDPRGLFEGLRTRLEEPLTSETVSANDEAPEARRDGGEAAPSNS